MFPFDRNSRPRSMDEFLDDFENFAQQQLHKNHARFARSWLSPGDLGLGGFFATDIRQSKDKIIVESDLPGVTRSQIGINIEGNNLKITANRPCPFEELKEQEGSPREYLTTIERPCGEFQREISLESDISVPDIKAGFKNGVLRIELPRVPKTSTLIKVEKL